MKIYLFYLIKTEISNTDYPAINIDEIVGLEEKECVLYAYTPKKEYAKLFIEMRNMKLFFEKVIDMENDEYELFYNSHISQILDYHSFNTKKIVNGVYIPEQILVLCTMLESDHVLYYTEEYVDNIISGVLKEENIQYLLDHPLNKELDNILNDIFIYSDMVNKVYPMEEINYDSYMVDDLSLFIILFSNTFKKGKHK